MDVCSHDQKVNLKPSEILRAQLIPGFSESLESSSLRITTSGYFVLTRSSFRSESGRIEKTDEGRFSPKEIEDLRSELKRLPRDIPIEEVIDDMDSRVLLFRRETDECRLEVIESALRHPTPNEQLFYEFWRKLHSAAEHKLRK